MPGMDGFETIKGIRENTELTKIPVIFLTADEDADTETTGLSLGAMDFIKKPFIPEVLLLRVRHTIELIRLQSDLSSEVEKKTVELRKKTDQLIEEHNKTERMTMQIVKALSGAIDAKDTYTNGHSTRVAQYSREIAKRFGYEEKRLEEIYMMGLLHDVGKIGIPDAVINKPANLNEDEFEVIKTHPVLGAKILGAIKEMPSLANGARWHHERYGGGGYPDNLKGEDIPIEARIIAVADSYDAMTSHRSYRAPLPQDVVRSEIEKGKGTQFDPRFADIMIHMIDEDINYEMKEQ
jgi:putative two-component system response regulator